MGSALAGRDTGARARSRTRLDWLIALAATAVFGGFAAVAHVPEMALAWRWVAGLVCAMLVLLVGTGLVLWRATRFN